MNDFLQIIRDLSHSRTLHLIAVVVHAVGIAFFAWAYTKIPSNVFLFFIGWCALYGAPSSAFLLRKDYKSAD